MQYNIAVIKGDGIGPEIVTEAMKAMEVVGEKFGHTFNFTECYAGGNAIDKYGIPLPQETLDVCKASDSVLLGAVGGPKWDSVPSDKRPERALLGLRSNLELFVNLRPAQMHAALADACPIKPEIIGDGFDILVCRELTGDVYFGKRGRRESELGETGWDDMNYSVTEVERIGRRAFDMAMKRNKKLTSVDKANVLETSRVWRETMHKLREEYPEPWLRTSGDIDILVHEQDVKRASQVLMEICGFSREGGDKKDISFMRDECVHVKLHRNLIRTDLIQALQTREIWAHAAKSESDYRYEMAGGTGQSQN